VSNLYVNPAEGNSYGGIIEAINELATANQKSKKYYSPNFQGIIDALLDLGRITDVPSGEFPPGWDPIYDEDGNLVDGSWSEYPKDGQLWFDTRQGRLFVWQSDSFYQCNGADGLTVVGEATPTREVIGGLWYNTLNANLYIYDGNTWSIVGGEAAVSTATLPLANGTRDTFSSNRPFLPDAVGLITQEHYNTWNYEALLELEAAIDNIELPDKLAMGASAPVAGEEGDFWYSTSKLQLYVWYDGAWVPTSTPLHQERDFIELVTEVSQLRTQDLTQYLEVLGKIEEVKSLPHHTYTVVDNNSSHIHYGQKPGVYLVNDKLEYTGVAFTGADGTEVSFNEDGILISTDALENRISNIELDYASKASVNAVEAELIELETLVQNLDYLTPADLLQLQGQINQLPAASELQEKLDANSGVLKGNLNADGYRITNLPAAVDSNEPVRKSEFDAYQADANIIFQRKSDGIIRNVTFQQLDSVKPSIDFSQSSNDSLRALQFKNNVDSDISTFGSTDSPWEYAWKFNSEEDFCWIGPNGKSVSITKDGLTAANLTLGVFQENTSDGQVVQNKIEVGETLTAYKIALQGVKTALMTASNFDQFKLAAIDALQGI